MHIDRIVLYLRDRLGTFQYFGQSALILLFFNSCAIEPAITGSGGVVVGGGHGGPIGARALQALAVVVGGWLLVARSRLRLWSDSNRSCVYREGSMEPLELSSCARVPLLSTCQDS